jgi:pentatricopeptide repeat protein
MPRVTLSLIVRNEEANLPACLSSAADLVDEIIVVDTGSTDGTRELAARLGARVFDFPWRDDFAAARNASIEHATGDWIFWLDADDWIDAENRERLRQLFAGLGKELVGYVMTYMALNDGGPGRHTVADHVQLFPNHPQIRWQYRVHEQILQAVERAGGSARATDVTIYTSGYQDPAAHQQKLARNLRLLQLDHAEHPEDPVIWFNLGRTLLRVGQVAESLPLLRQSVASLPSGNAFVIQTAYALMLEGYCRLGRFAEALTFCREGRTRFPDNPELLLAEGVILRDLGDLAGAEERLRRLLERDPGNELARIHLARLRPVSPFGQFDVSM